ncbi:MAG TPA: hypothetical protein PLO37_14525 [Candidatus Hydrogenedentes bacterium]|nr:hypothetical protein [Candidatus Hydrogenedentota bacterium]HPG68062.1 hypothetical protein [Candidatus Hydrogenedentota bacterium]
MGKKKPFDCVEMKDRIQAKLLEEYEGLTPEEERAKRLQKLAAGDSPAARLWQASRRQRAITSPLR